MKTLNSFLTLSTVILVNVLGVSIGMAQGVVTPPVGFVTISYEQGSDTTFSTALDRAVEFQGAVSSAIDNGATSTINLDGSPLSSNQFDPIPDTFYVKVASGSKTGMFYTVTTNDQGSITVDNNGDTLASVIDGELIRVIPFWTLNTIFPNGDGITQSSSLSPAAEILFLDSTTAGINLSSSASYFYYTDPLNVFGGPGWRQVGFPNTIVDNTILFPDSYVLIRDSSGGSGTVEHQLVGTVNTLVFRTPLNLLSASEGQDNFVAVNFPVNLTLSESNLFESGAFAESSSLSPVDQLLVFDASVAAQNKSSSGSYFYYTDPLNVFGGAGWRQVGFPNTIVDNVEVLESGRGVIVRKAATGSVQSAIWDVSPTFPVP